MAFTTWADLKTTMLNDMASGKWRTSEYSLDGLQMKYTSFNEFRAALEYVERRAAEEAGDVPTQICAIPAGGSRW